MANVNLTVTLRQQEDAHWCGPACIQMTREAYPTSPQHYEQKDLWRIIDGDPQNPQTRKNTTLNSTATGDWLKWDTDPLGMCSCLQGLNNPAGVYWEQVVDTTPETVMAGVLYWMEQRRFPTPVLINGGEHWVVLTGFVDHFDQNRNALVLDYISYNDPQCPTPWTLRPASEWYPNPQQLTTPWSSTVLKGGTWSGQYVAVLEPPKKTERVVVMMPEPTPRDKLMSPDAAREKANQWIKDLNLRERPELSLLRRDDVDSFEPLLVLDQPQPTPARLRSRRRKKFATNYYYYLVPFGIRTEFERSVRLARACVLVDAYDGRFEEVSAFAIPVRYLPREEALEIATGALEKKPKRLKTADMTLMFQPSTITQTRSWPFWRVILNDRTVYIDQSGRLYGRLEPGHGGN